MAIYQYFRAKKCIGKATQEDILEAKRMAARIYNAQSYIGRVEVARMTDNGPVHKFLFERIDPDERDFSAQSRPLPRQVLKELTDKVRLAINTKDESVLPQYHAWYMDNVGYDIPKYWERMDEALFILEGLCTTVNTTLKGWSLCYDPWY